jgi:hypothetical protein
MAPVARASLPVAAVKAALVTSTLPTIMLHLDLVLDRASGYTLPFQMRHMLLKNAHAFPLPRPGFDDLPLEDQIEYIQSLSDLGAAWANDLSIPEWQAKLLDERLAAFRADPGAGDPAEEVLQWRLEGYPSKVVSGVAHHPFSR